MSVIFVKVDVKQLVALGRKYPWSKPEACPECGQHLWWHGFVSAYLASEPEAVCLRSLVCPHCHSVHRLRPDSHWSRFWSSIYSIKETINYRQLHGRWRPDLPRSTQRQWWWRLRRKARLCLGLNWGSCWLAAFHALLSMGAIPVSRVMKCGDQATS